MTCHLIWKTLVWSADLFSLGILLYMAGLMVAVLLRNRRLSNISDQISLLRFQKFLLNTSGRITALEMISLVVLGFDLIISSKSIIASMLLSVSIILLLYGRYLSNNKQRPIQNQVLKFSDEYIPGKWNYLRERYFYLHTVKTIIILFILAAIINVVLFAR
jgi:hypothetical protein